MQDLKQLQNSLPAVSVEEDMASLKVFAMNLENFQKDITETMQVSLWIVMSNMGMDSLIIFNKYDNSKL